jgi:hypothetical protein
MFQILTRLIVLPVDLGFLLLLLWRALVDMRT